MTPVLWFRQDSGPGWQVAVPDGTSTVGRDETADIVVPAADARFVSRRHARLTRTPDAIVLEDLGSANGTIVNGRRVDHATLSDGDEIQFGRHGPVARFHVDRPPPAAEPGAGGIVLRAERPSAALHRAVEQALSLHSRRYRRLVLIAIVSAVAILAAVLRQAPSADPVDTLRELADRYADRMVLIEVGIAQDGRYVSLGVGSGFFVDDAGAFVTNKHVVQPHLFSERIACLVASMARTGEPELELTAWPGATPFRRDLSASAGDRSLGYRSRQRALWIVATSPDTLDPPSTVSCAGQDERAPFTMTWRRHAADDADLALLRLQSKAATRSMPLAAGRVGVGDRILVYGFPGGFEAIEGVVAEPAFRIGRVLRADRAIETDAVLLHGSSGGPVINAAGEVVGVATRGPADSFNSAIAVEHVRRLLGAAR